MRAYALGLCAGLFLIGCGSGESLATSDNAVAYGTANVAVSLNDWGTGYCANVDITNSGTIPSTSWTITFALNGATVTSNWSSNAVVSGSVLTLTPAAFNAQLAAGGKASLGFCGNKTSAAPSVSSASIITGANDAGVPDTTVDTGVADTKVDAANDTGVADTKVDAATDTGVADTKTDSGSDSGTPTKKFVGNITTNGAVRSDFKTFWNQITPENEGKWGSVESTRGKYNWAGLDAAYNYAKANGITFKQHTFVWGSQQPTWLGSLSTADQAAAVESWIKAYCTRYPDTAIIDVVNEPPPHTTPVYINALGGTGSSGYDWIVKSFQLARKYCPNSTLVLNDYNNIEYSTDHNNFVNIVKKIKAAGAPIDAVGAQAHDAFKLSTSTVQNYINDLATQTGLPVYITEYDINLADDTQQKNVMQSQFTMFYTNANVKGITLWGYIVGSTWETNSGLMTSSGTKRPAMTWLMSYLGK